MPVTRWINLWWSADFADDSTDHDSKTTSSAFVGNLVLVVGIIFGIFVVHITVISAVEALWISKVLCFTPSGALLRPTMGVITAR